jgi:hypothetical protein
MSPEDAPVNSNINRDGTVWRPLSLKAKQQKGSRSSTLEAVFGRPELAGEALCKASTFSLSKPIIFTMWKVGLLSKAAAAVRASKKSRLYLHFSQCGNAENGGKGLDPDAVSW